MGKGIYPLASKNSYLNTDFQNSPATSMFNVGKQFIPYIKNSILSSSNTQIRTGALTITFPFGFIKCMLSFKVHVHKYGDNGGFAEYLIDGYCYDDERWLFTHALCITNNSFPNKNVPVSFCKNSDGKAAVSIGSIDTEWNYCQVIVKDILSGWKIPSEDIYNDTTIHFETSDLGNVLSVVENPWIGNF